MKHRTLPALLLALLAPFAHAAGSICRVTSTAQPPTVVELYTSEGCSSCPPADRWLSTLNGRSDVLSLAFHVTYWDRLGWTDRYGSAEGTARQYALAQADGERGVYTPQVRVQGRDWRAWPKLPAGATAPSSVQVTLLRDGETVTARVEGTGTATGTPMRLSAYWAVVEDGHQSQVKAGENAGETLKHDSVVRLVKPVAAWSAASGQEVHLQVSRGVAEHPRRVVFVVTDALTHKPLQAVALGC